MPDESLLREMAREAIRSGKLPTRRQDLLLGATGTGRACAVCWEPIPHNQAELEVEFNQHSVPPGLVTYRLHPRCFAAWEFERTKVDGTQSIGENCKLGRQEAGDHAQREPMGAESVRVIIRQKLRDGRLPNDDVSKFWRDPGDGDQCDACDSPFTKDEQVMDGIASTLGGDTKPVQFHAVCFHLWEHERREPKS